MRVHPAFGRAVAFVLLGCFSAVPARALPAAPPGHLRSVAVVRVGVAPSVDGVLDDEAWRHGTATGDFWLTDVQRAPADQTRVIVIQDETTVYFAFTLFDARPDLISTTQPASAAEDRVTVELDPLQNHRQISRFTVTASGAQSDAISGRSASRSARPAWRAAARRTTEGWTAEIAIPFALLDLDPRSDRFGLNLTRYQRRTGESSDWANLTPRRLPEEMGHLTGLRLPQPHLADDLTITHYASGRSELGTDLRSQWRGMTSAVSVHPDFSIVNQDVTNISFSHTEKRVADRRPFFRDGADFFGSGEVFDSSRIQTFDVGMKTFGQVDDYKLGVLAVTTADGAQTNYVGSVAREVGRAFTVSTTLAGEEQDTGHTATVQVQAGGRIGPHLRVDANIARSAADVGAPGTRQRGELSYHGSHVYSGVWADHTDSGYLPTLGFLAGDMIGTVGRGTYAGYTRSFGGWSRHVDLSASYDSRNTLSGLPQRESISVYSGVVTAAHVRLNTGVTAGVYRPRGRTPNEWMDALNDERFYLASAFYDDPSGRFGYGVQYSWGVTGADGYDSLAPSIWVAPGQGISASYSFERATHGDVHHQHVLSGTWQITPDQSVGARWVDYDGGYYKVSYRRAVAQSVDALGVYTADPYAPASVNFKLIWSLSRLAGTN